MPLWEQWRLSFDDKMPIYRQIILQFNQCFVRGEIKPGDRIPSIREISAALKVNANTMQRVYQEMERGGLISSRRGTGYFVTEDLSMAEKTRSELAQDSLRRFVEEMKALGLTDGEIQDELSSYIKGGCVSAAPSRSVNEAANAAKIGGCVSAAPSRSVNEAANAAKIGGKK